MPTVFPKKTVVLLLPASDRNVNILVFFQTIVHYLCIIILVPKKENFGSIDQQMARHGKYAHKHFFFSVINMSIYRIRRPINTYFYNNRLSRCTLNNLVSFENSRSRSGERIRCGRSHQISWRTIVEGMVEVVVVSSQGEIRMTYRSAGSLISCWMLRMKWMDRLAGSRRMLAFAQDTDGYSSSCCHVVESQRRSRYVVLLLLLLQLAPFGFVASVLEPDFHLLPHT